MTESEIFNLRSGRFFELNDLQMPDIFEIICTATIEVTGQPKQYQYCCKSVLTEKFMNFSSVILRDNKFKLL